MSEDDSLVPEEWYRIAERDLGAAIPATAISEMRAQLDAIDFATYSINPQVHAFDDLSVMETLGAQGPTVESARAIVGDRPIGKVSGDGAFIDGEAEFEQFAMDPGRTPPAAEPGGTATRGHPVGTSRATGSAAA